MNMKIKPETTLLRNMGYSISGALFTDGILRINPLEIVSAILIWIILYWSE